MVSKVADKSKKISTVILVSEETYLSAVDRLSYSVDFILSFLTNFSQSSSDGEDVLRPQLFSSY